MATRSCSTKTRSVRGAGRNPTRACPRRKIQSRKLPDLQGIRQIRGQRDLRTQGRRRSIHHADRQANEIAPGHFQGDLGLGVQRLHRRDPRNSERHRAVAFRHHLQHRALHRCCHVPVRARFAARVEGERGARLRQLVARGVLGVARRVQRALGGAQREAGLLARRLRDEAFLGEPRLALEIGLCLVALGGVLERLRPGAREQRLHRADAPLQLARGARVEECRRGGREQREHLALVDRVAGSQRNALQAPGERRRNHVALAHTRLAVVRHGLLESTARRWRGLDVDRARAQRPGRYRHQRHDADRQQNPVSSCHSRVFSTATRSRLSMRLRTMRALITPAATTTAPE